MTTPPKATPEQPSFAEQGKLSVEDLAQSHGRRDWLAGPETERTEGDSSSDRQASYGDLKNNQTAHWKVEER